jgi:hypothetical protein
MLAGMSGPPTLPSRRAFLGRAAVTAAVTGAAAVGAALAGDAAGPYRTAAAALGRPAGTAPRQATIAENARPGDRGWWISRLGAPDEILGYTGQASVLPGQPVELYVSTTAREFTVRAFRIGWYGGDLARQVWQSGPVRGLRQRAAALHTPAYLHALDGASALVSPGHDEYWTPEERGYVTAARDQGMNIAFLGANAMFRRIRLAPTDLGDNRAVICYRTSYQHDPLYGKNDPLVTNDFRAPPAPDPESSLTGTLYEGYPTVADFVVTAPDAWPLAGTGAAHGTRFAAMVGIEYDRVNPGSPVQRPIQVLSHSPLTCRGVNSYADSAYYTHPGGAGVYSTGTMRWVESLGPPAYGWGITRACGRFTRRVTANVLRAFADGPAAGRYPARDNLGEMGEWAGDPIAARHNLWS